MTSQLNDLKSTHIADEVKKTDDNTKKNSTDIPNAKTSLENNKSVIDDLEREASFFSGSYYFNQQSYLIYEPKPFSFKQTSAEIKDWKSAGIDNYSLDTGLRGVVNISGDYPYVFKGNRMSVIFSGNYGKESKSIYPLKSLINIYIVYSLDPESNARNTDFAAQSYLFGAVKITKEVNTSNYKYVGYGICFDEGSNFSIGNITNGKNVIILGCDASSSSLANNKKNNIIALGKDFIQGLTTTGTGNTIYVEKIYKTNMTEPNKKFVLSLHYNGDDSYLFVNGVEQLKFKAQSFINNMKKPSVL